MERITELNDLCGKIDDLFFKYFDLYQQYEEKQEELSKNMKEVRQIQITLSNLTRDTGIWPKRDTVLVERQLLLNNTT